MSASVKCKVLVIGLDGVPLDLVRQFAGDGRMPNLKRLMDNGAVGPLASTVPPTSAPSWSAFMTGKNPGKTGVYDFLYRREGSYVFPPVNASLRHGKSLWGIVSEHGGKVGVVNVPISYPVERVNGYMISGWMTPYTAKDFSYPAGLEKELMREVGAYRIYPMETLAESKRETFFKACYDLLAMRTRSSLYLMDKYPWDLFMVVFFDTDRILHQAWHYLDPTHPWRRKNPDENLSGWVKDYFQKLDESIGKLVEKAGEDTLVVVMSDHGMGAAHNFIVLNNWLVREGFLTFKGDAKTRVKQALFNRGFTLRNVHHMADKLGLVKHAEYKGLYSMDRILKKFFLSFLDVDWSRSVAYSFGRHYGPIYLNVKGREPEGIVQPGDEYEAVRDRVAQAAMRFVDPRTGRPIPGRIIKREDVYSGPRLEDAPDLMLVPQEPTDIFFGLADFGSNRLIDEVYRYSGMHRDDGMLVMHGGPIRPGEAVTGANITDMAPTVLYAMGLPVPTDMDGRLIAGAFTQEHLSANPLAYEGNGHLEGEGKEYTTEEQAQVEEHLRALGYFG